MELTGVIAIEQASFHPSAATSIDFILAVESRLAGTICLAVTYVAFKIRKLSILAELTAIHI